MQHSVTRSMLVILIGACLVLSTQLCVAAEVSDLLKDMRAARRVTRESTSLLKQIKSVTNPITEKRKDTLPTDGKNVIFYSASWCGYCNKARTYMDENKVAYVEYDTETSSKGREDFGKLGARGVPVLLIGDERMEGWSESKFKRLHKQLEAPKSGSRTETSSTAQPLIVNAGSTIDVGTVLAAKIDNVAVFAGSTRDSTVVARLKKSEEVVAVETGSSEMVKVETASGSGWVDSRLFTATMEQ